VDHQHPVGLGQPARQRDGLLGIAAIVGHDELDRQAADPAGAVDLVTRELGADQPVLSPVDEESRHRHDHAEAHLVARQLRPGGRRKRQAGERHGDESDPDRTTASPDHVSSLSPLT